MHLIIESRDLLGRWKGVGASSLLQGIFGGSLLLFGNGPWGDPHERIA